MEKEVFLKEDYPVGSTISIEGVKCKVVEDIDLSEYNCKECILNGKIEGIMCRNLACLNSEREDHKDVHFVKIKDHE